MVMIFVIVLLKRMFTNENDANFTKETAIDLNLLPLLNLNETHLTVFHVLRKYGKPVYLNDTVR